MAELRFQSRPRIFLFDHTTASPSSSRTIVVARMRHTKGTDKSLVVRRSAKKQHHLWKKRDPTQSFRKASNLVRIVTNLPNEQEVFWGALDKWVAFDTEFPVIAIAKSLDILRKTNHWFRIIQVCKWLLSKGQVLTWSTYDTLLVAFNMEGRIDEAEFIYSKIVEDHTRSTPKKLFSRMISIYDHHHLPNKVLEVFSDMEEFGVHPDGDTTWRIARALAKSAEPEKVKGLLDKYLSKWKYLYFDGNKVRVKRGGASDPFTDQPKLV
ncbi:pentatricopeptide repeat-containing protein [Carex littledalei]|uniref:Pentatricopeptide repeat-containing protein n=1 Tax=Carex littledalei TaxID=544730 RepID=A0A833V1P1_9POAL|nr:pentatricopeptide repeat-containing protein [Carex littledalei]